MSKRLLKRPEVLEMTALSSSTMYRLIQRKMFPNSVSLTGPGGRAKGWKISDIEAWIESRDDSSLSTIDAEDK